jgi:hypothetical protein
MVIRTNFFNLKEILGRVADGGRTNLTLRKIFMRNGRI